MNFGKFIIDKMQNYNSSTSIRIFIKQNIMNKLDISKNNEVCNIGVGGYGFVIPNFYAKKKNSSDAMKFYFIPQSSDRSKIYFESDTYEDIEYSTIIFNDTMLGEFIIGSIIGEYLKIKNNPHSVIHRDIYICKPKFEALSMESLGFLDQKTKKLWSSLYHLVDYLMPTKNYMSNTELFFYVLFQVLFTLICLKKNIKFYHMDLHPGNVLIKHDISKKYDYFEYIYEGKKVVIRNPGFLVKLADFGFSIVNIEKMVIISEPVIYPSRVKIRKTLKKLWPKYPHGISRHSYPEYIELIEYFHKNNETTCDATTNIIRYLKAQTKIKTNLMLFDMKTSWKRYRYPSCSNILSYLIKNNPKYIYDSNKKKKLTIYE